MESKKPAVVIDLDGTMCDIGERDPYKGHLCETDQPVKAMVEIAEALYFNDDGMGSGEGSYFPVFLTGRNETAREATTKWIERHTAFVSFTESTVISTGEKRRYPGNYDLIMRTSQDYRPAAVWKHDAMLQIILPKYEVLCAFEDHLGVARMMRKEFGLTVFTIGELDY